MRCPRCSFEGEPINGACPQCGYRRVNISESLLNSSSSGSRPPSSSLSSPSLPLGGASGPLRSPSLPLGGPSGPLRSPSLPLGGASGPLRPLALPPGSSSGPLRSLSGPSRPISLYTAKSGDTLNQGRYRLVDQLILPDNQQGQGAAWLAVDTAAGQTQVVIREVVVPAEDQANKKQIARTIAMRLSEAAQHSSCPKVLDVFNELDNYFIVLQHIEGESLASLLRRQGGALPERTVAEYGRQLCEMLVALSHQQPPLVHGAISPETVIVSPDRSRVHLIHLPLFPPKDSASAGSTAGYKAPEQARGIVDPASDLYSVAATMHHAVTGFDPRERIAFFYPPARRLNPVVSQQMETILAQELRLSSPQRYARAADMQAELATLLAMRLPEPERKPVTIASDPLKLDTRQMREQLKRRSRNQLGIFAAACLLILLGVLAWYIYPSLKISTSASPTPNAAATMTAIYNHELSKELQTYQKDHVGLSDGTFAFDTYAGRDPEGVKDKQQAAQALQAGNLSAAQNLYLKATTKDATDAESQIYVQDLQIKQSGAPYITIVLSLPLNSDPVNLSFTRPDLESAYEFQNRVNSQNLLPNHLKLRILVANTGDAQSDDNLVNEVAQYVANRVKDGNPDNIVAAVGWPTTGATYNAVPALTSAHIPLVAQTASGVKLNGVSSYFFRVNPTDDSQGQALGKYAVQALQAKRILVIRDTNDTYSQSLANAFASSVQQQHGIVIQDALPLSGNSSPPPETVAQFQQGAVQMAIKNQVDLIFIAGYDQDAVRLAHALGNVTRLAPWNTYLANLKVLGGDAVDTGLLLGQGTSADAALATHFPEDMRRLSFTSFSDISEWAGKTQPVFFKDWADLYKGMNTAPPITNDAIMTNDAFGAIADAIGLVKGPITGEQVRNALASIGTKNIPVYSGISGQIHFGSDGNAINKAVVVLTIAAADASGLTNVVEFKGTAGQFA